MAGPPAPFTILLTLALAAGCAAPGPYPSLAPRPAEKVYSDDDEERQPTLQPEDPALAVEIDRLVAAARAGGEEFDARLPAAETATAAAGGPGSDSWIEAQQAVSRLEVARTQTTTALADLDALSVQRSGAGTLGPGDRERLRSGLAAVQALASAQAERLQRLEGRLNRP